MPPPNSNQNVVVDLKKSFKKSLKGKEIDRALAYYESHPEEIEKAENPIGFVVYAIRNNLDLVENKNKEIIEARKKWAQKNEFYAPGGSGMAQKDGYLVTSGSKNELIRYESRHLFWQQKGLEFKT